MCIRDSNTAFFSLGSTLNLNLTQVSANPPPIIHVPLFTFDVGQDGFTNGIEVSGAGDVNGDGLADLIVQGTTTGGTQVLSGSDGSIIHVFDFVFVNTGSVSGAGDVNGDGFDDLILGTPGLSNGTNSTVQVFSGSDGSIIHDFDVVLGSGGSVSGAGDVNGDGFADCLLYTSPSPRDLSTSRMPSSA